MVCDGRKPMPRGSVASAAENTGVATWRSRCRFGWHTPHGHHTRGEQAVEGVQKLVGLRPAQPRQRVTTQIAQPVAHPWCGRVPPPAALQPVSKLVTDPSHCGLNPTHVAPRPRRHHATAAWAPVTPKQQRMIEAVKVAPHEPMAPHPAAPASQAPLGSLPRVVATQSEYLVEFHRHLPYHRITLFVGPKPKGKRAESSRKTLRPLHFCQPKPGRNRPRPNRPR